MNLELVTIGTELLLGFTIDTNAAFLGQLLSAAGIRVTRRASVGDDREAIRAAVDEALSRTGCVITTGGLGPTGDDITKETVADLLGIPLVFDDAVWQAVLARYQRRGVAPAVSNRSQAMVPAGAMALPNAWGTAPGLWIKCDRGVVIMLPGVPLEMRMLAEHEVLPRLRGEGTGLVIRSATLRTSGIPESSLAERLTDVEATLAPLTLAYLPGVAGVDLRVTAWNLTADAADAALRGAIHHLRAASGEWTYGEGDTDLAAVVLELVRQSGSKLAVAESCTGGLLGGRLTDVAGSSDTFQGGVIAYDNRVKQEQLGVPADLISAHGAVSDEVVRAMARGAARKFGVDVTMAVTGIAGPGGGSEAKPVGTVWIGWYVGGRIESARSVFGGLRHEVRERAVQGALMGLWRLLEKRESEKATG